jgi:LPXTG-motif cell wall-anchored protein
VKRLARLCMGLMAVAILTVGVFAGGAGAQTGNEVKYGGLTLAISDPAVNPGDTIELTGSGFLADATVTVTVQSHTYVAGTTTTNSAGDFSFGFPAPDEVGAHTATATDGVNSISIEFEVLAAGAVDSTGSLPYTGSNNSVPVAQIGAGLVAAGAVLVLMVRKRQHHLASVRVDA